MSIIGLDSVCLVSDWTPSVLDYVWTPSVLDLSGLRLYGLGLIGSRLASGHDQY